MDTRIDTERKATVAQGATGAPAAAPQTATTPQTAAAATPRSWSTLRQVSSDGIERAGAAVSGASASTERARSEAPASATPSEPRPSLFRRIGTWAAFPLGLAWYAVTKGPPFLVRRVFIPAYRWASDMASKYIREPIYRFTKWAVNDVIVPGSRYVWQNFLKRPVTAAWQRGIVPAAKWVTREVLVPLWTKVTVPMSRYVWREWIKPTWSKVIVPITHGFKNRIVLPFWNKLAKPFIDKVVKPVGRGMLKMNRIVCITIPGWIARTIFAPVLKPFAPLFEKVAAAAAVVGNIIGEAAATVRRMFGGK